MISFIIRQWKCHKPSIVLIILGFFIANLVMSIGISITTRQIELSSDNLIGGPEKQTIISVSDVKPTAIFDDIELLEQYSEVQMLNMSSVKISNKNRSFKFAPVGVWFVHEEEWHIPIISGDYLSVENVRNGEEVAVVGRSMAEKMKVDVGDVITIKDFNVKVIGICGREYRETQWDTFFYIPGRLAREKSVGIPNEKSKATFSFITKSHKDDIVNLFNSGKLVTARYATIDTDIAKGNPDSSATNNSIILTIILSGGVFIIAIINITNLMIYWVLERQKTYAIIKALGANNAYIFKTLLLEVTFLMLISALMAVGVQEILHLLIPQLPLQISVSNVLIAVGVSAVFGCLTSLLPVRVAMGVDCVKFLNKGDE